MRVFSLTAAWIKRCGYVIPLVPTSLRYFIYLLSGRRFQANRPHDFSQLAVISPGLLRLHGMTSISERAYLYWYARHMFARQGAIVDLGCWLGSTTAALALGLERNVSEGPGPKRIDAYDRFIWHPTMPPPGDTEVKRAFHDGESFLDEFKSRTRRWTHLISAHPGDLAQAAWDGGSIEFLVIDAMKSWELTSAIIGQFYPALIPGRSLILHQDFAHWFTPWIHLTQYRLRDYFAMEYVVPRSTSVVFRLVQRIPEAMISEIRSSDGSFKSDEIRAAFDYSMSLVPSDKRPNVAAAKVMYFVHSGQMQEARNELAECRRQHLDFGTDLSIVERRVLGSS
jgi:hypothetical protein